MAYKFKADGIYIPSFNKKKTYLNLEKRNFKIIGSAHSQKEIHQKIDQKCKAVFLSPLFYVKKSKKYLNIHKFNYLSHLNKDLGSRICSYPSSITSEIGTSISKLFKKKSIISG